MKVESFSFDVMLLYTRIYLQVNKIGEYCLLLWGVDYFYGFKLRFFDLEMVYCKENESDN